MQLLKSIKKNLINPILQEIAVNLFKSIIATGIFGAGVALMTNSIVGGILIAIGLLFILWLVKSWINETKRDDNIFYNKGVAYYRI
jgi:arginine exporter protein ArgO